VQALDLMKRAYGYYIVRLVMLAAAFAVVALAFFWIGDAWAQLGVAAVLGAVLTQIIFYSHDAAHRQMFATHRSNEIASLIMGTFFGGVSLGWWNNKHNKHHAAPNQVGKDSDIDPSIVHFYPAEAVPQNRILAFMHRHQGWWFFPLLAIEMLNLHFQGVQALVTRPELKHRRLEIGMLIIRLGGYPALLLVLLSPGKALAFLGVQLAVTGLYLGLSFSASHIGMAVLPSDARLDFFRRQVLTSRNVSGGGFASFGMGGLNYQIEHHLFPSMPRPHLRKAVPIVQNFCANNDIAYNEVNILRAWYIVASYLNRVGLSAAKFTCPMVAALRPS